MTKRVVATLMALTLVGLAFGGCSSTSGPGEIDQPDHQEPVTYEPRTSPENVLLNLIAAYEDMNAPRYLECLAEDFTFYTSEQAQAEVPNLPESWDKTTEVIIHEEMMGQDSPVSSIDLEMQPASDPVEIPGPLPADPVEWQYTCTVDLRVREPIDLVFFATAPSVFLFRIDPDEVGAGGESLWEIVEWYDLNDEARGDSPVLPTSWGAIKAMYLD